MALRAALRPFAEARTLQVVPKVTEAITASSKNVLIVGSKDKIAHDSILSTVPAGIKSVLSALINELSPGSSTTTHHVEGDKMVKYTIAALPAVGSRNNPPARPHSISSFVQTAVESAKGDLAVLVALDTAEHALAAACAVARSLPVYDKKTHDDAEKAAAKSGATTLGFIAPEGDLSAEQLTLVEKAAHAVREVTRIVDAPAEEMNTDHFHAVAADWVKTRSDVTIEAVVGDELIQQGFGGIHGVGRAGVKAPRLVVLRYEPSKDAEYSAALVGKGIVYDTGGLSLKISGNMVGMKGDCGGAGGVFGAFKAAVESGLYSNFKLYCVLCLAENAIGPTAFRNDDILTLFSGKTVEINNTDAEGRLVLGDGVAYASQVLRPDLIIDMATLTGAQLITTGKVHAGVVTNKLDAEHALVRAGLRSGDAAFPMLYAPELLRSEFKSAVADMKNSVKDRMNAQSSCAATFIEDHLSPDWKGTWVHCDIAGPAHKGERATGYGVALVLDLLKNEAKAVCRPQQ